ncbi:unnamed protein product [Amoebophrya sp. A25]|nr:unnamed protein product [Amoebophrya sp. A25]|eukprot:GSA25T00008292001.1
MTVNLNTHEAGSGASVAERRRSWQGENNRSHTRELRSLLNTSCKGLHGTGQHGQYLHSKMRRSP